MPLRSLLLCRQQATANFINRVFREFSIEVEACAEPQAALRSLKDGRFEAIVVDTEDRVGAMTVLDSLKALPSCKNSLRIVLADHQTVLATAFSTGTHLVIYKPVSADRLRNSLRALCPLMGRKLKREFARIRVRIPAIVRTEGRNLPGSIFDISGGGIALSTKESIPATKMLNIDFALPGRTGMINTTAAMVWNDVSGRLGAQFVEIEPTSRKAVCDWVAAQVRSNRLRKAVRPS